MIEIFLQIWLYSSLVSLLGFFFIILVNNEEEIEKYKEVSTPFDYHFIMLAISVLPFLSTVNAIETIKRLCLEIIIFIIELIYKKL